MIPALAGMGEFRFIPNAGNIGDMLIDVATRQVFRRLGVVTTTEASHPHLVYGGGGRFVPFYDSLDELTQTLTAPQVRHCIILPQSFYEVDEFVRLLDERHTVFCREARSLEYCRSLNGRARFMLEDDMALHLNPLELPQINEDNVNSLALTPQYAPIQRGVEAAVRVSTRRFKRAGRYLRVAFLPRRGKESIIPAGLLSGMDVSDFWYGKGDGSQGQALFIRAFLNVFSHVDAVVSDRLHVCLTALFAGCQVYLLDNCYGKLSGVYRQSLSSHPRAHLVTLHELAQLFPEAMPEMTPLASTPFPS